MKIEDGGQAFPNNEKSDSGNHHFSHPGMTLRDYFAGQAMSSARTELPEYDLRALFGDRTGIRREEILAADAYRIADAMLARREKP